MLMNGTTTANLPGSPQRWAVVGGGILGMTLAYRLAKKGHDVTIYEAADHLGGLADAWTLGDTSWDRHYHVTLMSDVFMRQLLEELDLADQLEWVETKTGFYTDGNMYSMSNSVEFLKFPPLGLIDKFRLGGTIFWASKVKNWKRLEKIYVADWLRKLSGKRTFEKMWLPLLRAKLGENYKQTSAAFIWATIARMYAARRTGLKKEMFGYVRGGYRNVLEKFEAELRRLNVKIECSQPVQNVHRQDGGGLTVKIADKGVNGSGLGQPAEFDRVVLSIPSSRIADSVPQLNTDEHQRLKNVQYQGVICASLLLKKPLTPYYVTNITDTWVPFTGVIEMTNLVPPETFGGQHLVYLPKYVPAASDAFNVSDEQLETEFVDAILRMHPHLERDDVTAFRVSRVRQVMAIPTLNYSETVPGHLTSLPGCYVVNSSQICNGTLNVNENIKLADEALTEIYKASSQIPSSRSVANQLAASTVESSTGS